MRAQVKRAKKFLDIVYRHAPEPVVLVVTHSGFARSILLAVKREPYRPQNAELIPVLVERAGRHGDIDELLAAADDDAWIDEVLQQHADSLADEEEQQPPPPQLDKCLIRRLFKRLAGMYGDLVQRQ